MFRRLSLTVSLILASVLPFFAGGAAAATTSRATLAGHVPAWANAANFRGVANNADSIDFRVYLNWQKESEIEALAQAVSDPRSSDYGHFLTPDAFRQAYAPSQASVNAVKSWLASQGFAVGYVPANGHYVSAQGTVAQAAAAFGTTFGTYNVRGKALRSPSSDISVPGSVASLIQGIIGLDDSGLLVHTNIAQDPNAAPSPAFVSASPCSSYWGQKLASGFTDPYGSATLPFNTCGYTPQQIKGAYGISGYDGTGQTVVIIDAFASPTIQADLDHWSINRSLPSTEITQIVTPGLYKVPENAGDPQGWYGEETLDVEAVHGMAPAANIVFVGAPNPGKGLDASLNLVVDQHLGSIVTNSYGYDTEALPQTVIGVQETIILQGVVEGIGIYFSSGDNGDESATTGGATTVDFPASSPFVTAVGGTSLAVGARNTYLFETAWGTAKSTWTNNAWSPAAPGAWIYGSGGGVSRLYAEPSYQQGIVPVSVFNGQGRTGRAVPDISADADPTTGYLIGQTQTFPDGSVKYSEYRIGGTSLSSPLIAGIMALADQASGKPHGFANPILYERLAGNSAVHDIVNPASTVSAVRTDYVDGVDAVDGYTFSLRTMNQTQSLVAGQGYDDVTGLGTPSSSFISALN